MMRCQGEHAIQLDQNCFVSVSYKAHFTHECGTVKQKAREHVRAIDYFSQNKQLLFQIYVYLDPLP